MLESFVKYLIFFLVLVSCQTEAFAQKPPISFTTYGKWPSVEIAVISNDGKYALYDIKNGAGKSTALIIQATNGAWKLELPGISAAEFTQDSKLAVFRKPHDSLCLVTLGDSKIEQIPGVASYALPKRGRGDWIAYQFGDGTGNLVVRNIENGYHETIGKVANYRFISDGTGMLLQTASKTDTGANKSLCWLNLSDDRMKIIWHGKNADGFVFDQNDTQVAFVAEDLMGVDNGHSLWCYKIGAEKAYLLIDDQLTGLGDGLVIDNINMFSRDGSRLFIRLKEASRPKANPDAVPLNVWSYADPILQSRQIQLFKDNPMPSYDAVLFLKDRRILQLTFKGEAANLSLNDDNQDFGLVNTRKGDGGWGWNRFFDSTFLVSTTDGTRRFNRYFSNGKLFPEGRYVVYFDENEGDYYSYETKTGVIRDITRNIHTHWGDISTRIGQGRPTRGSAPAGWVDGDKSVLLFDTYDIWQVDPAGQEPPLNLTNGYGRGNHIIFRFIENMERSALPSQGTVVLSGFNRDNKENGFFRIALGRRQDPEILTMGPYTWYAPQKQGADGYGRGMRPVKAANSGGYIVTRMSATESDNFFYTNDFKAFRQLSDLAPEKTCNWMSTQLLTWRTPDGIRTKGILFKPEDFDPKRKYPVIFYYYELLSDNLNTFLKPEPSDGDLNIAWYVSNGYLVVEPDLYYKATADRLEASYNTIMSAARYIATFPYVDSKRMGIEGISWGGIQTNYIITHSHLFAAVCSASSIADFIGAYGELSHGGMMDEGFPGRQDASLWEKPGWYVQHSPVMNAHQVTSPFLMFETTHDGACPFVQCVEFFTDLRRLGKKVWMLEYEDGNHGVWGRSADDFSIRMAQFFDYYLKGARAPEWMVDGIPASRKGIDDGLKLEPAGIGPRLNVLTPEEQRKVDELMHRKPNQVTIP